ncbi:hypothetical protein ES707_05380 [subsurface metagenome]
MSRSHSIGTMALVATAAMWGSSHVVARAARDIVPLPSLVFWRWTLAAVILTVVGFPSLRTSWPAARPRLAELSIGGAIGVGLFSYLLLGGAYRSLALEVGFINATTPIWIVLIGLIERRSGSAEDEVTPALVFGLVLALAGTLLIISKGRPQDLLMLRFSLGNLWSLLAAISFAWFSIQIRRWTVEIEPLPLTIITAWTGLLFVMLPVYVGSLVMGNPWLTWNEHERWLGLAAISYIGLIPTMLGNIFYLYGVATTGATRAAAFLYLSPLFSAGLAVTWLGERFAWYHVLGTIAIFSGLLVVGRSSRQRSKA